MKYFFKNKFSSKIGQRNIKTALAVLSCILLFQLIGRNNSILACISAIICMQDTVENSVTIGKHRLLGTLIGGILGALYLIIINYFSTSPKLTPFLVAIGIIFVIYFCNLINKPESVIICCIVFLGITLSYDNSNAYVYTLSRTIDTLIGVGISVIINKYFDVYKFINIKRN